MTKRKLVECALGMRCLEQTARRLDEILKTLPKDSAYAYRTKAVASTIETEPTERTDISYVSTRAVDRSGEIVDPDGIDLEDYKANSVVLFGHDQDKPIGRALWIKSDQQGIVAKTLYSDKTETARDAFALIQDGVLKGKSIGFLPLDLREPTQDERAQAAFKDCNLVITKSLLFEYSVVSCPCNPQALVHAINKGTSLDLLNFKKIGHVRAKAKRTNWADPMAKALDELVFDPDLIAQNIIQQLKQRGRV